MLGGEKFMSLVAAWKEHNTPYLVGDILVSTRDEFDFKENHFAVPTRDDVIDILPRENGIRITGAWQKIYRVSDSFAIGWAGNRQTARTVIKDLFSRFENRNPSAKDVEDVLATYHFPDKEYCLLIGWIVTPGRARCFRWRTNEPEALDVAQEFFEGLGGAYLREILKPAGESGKEPLVNSALGKVANLLGHEIYYGTNLKSAFGGSYELIYYDEGFRVLPSATFVFLSATEEENGLLVAPSQRYLKSRYDNGVLQTMVVSDINGWPPQIALHYAHPIYREPPRIERG